MIDPLVLRAGERVFREDTMPRPLRFIEGPVTTLGVTPATQAVAEG